LVVAEERLATNHGDIRVSVQSFRDRANAEFRRSHAAWPVSKRLVEFSGKICNQQSLNICSAGHGEHPAVEILAFEFSGPLDLKILFGRHGSIASLAFPQPRCIIGRRIPHG
jgi:hypothetical protein